MTPIGVPITAPAISRATRFQGTSFQTEMACMMLALTSRQSATTTAFAGSVTSAQLETRIAEKPKPE
jgi:hypothetical protein